VIDVCSWIRRVVSLKNSSVEKLDIFNTHEWVLRLDSLDFKILLGILILNGLSGAEAVFSSALYWIAVASLYGFCPVSGSKCNKITHTHTYTHTYTHTHTHIMSKQPKNNDVCV
jgi:hypothetical protein